MEEAADPQKSIGHQQKRNRVASEPPPDISVAKKAKAANDDIQIEIEETGKTPSPTSFSNDDSNIGNESDSDADYDDLDDIVVPSDAEGGQDFMDDIDDDDGDLEDDTRSVTSTATTMSTGSVGSNTPSLVGESLESFSIGGTEGGPKRKAAWVSQAPNLTDSPALRRSLFSNIPPTINFMLHNETSAHQLPDVLRKQLKWKLSNITPAIVKRCASNSGFRLMRKTCNDWTATWGKHMKSPLFKEIKESQKINHFPGTFNIGRKDRLWKNYHRLMIKHGKTEFGFLPRTFCLPADTKLLRKVWERKGGKGRWIVKPPALARGAGIKVVNKWNQIPKTRPLVVQRYVARPYLINQTKFDLRLYVLVTSMNPLRIYLYDDGLVRFASNKYTNESNKVGDVYTHLTNYSINKNSSTYMTNEDSTSAQGHKWTLKSLWRHFDAEGIDHSVIWEKIKDLMIKTIISAEGSMSALFQSNVSSRYSCYELFGFDILLDSRLKPWLIEVNISPSLHSTSTLDLDVKSPLATEVFNMARYHIPNRLRLQEQREIAEKMGYSNMPSLCHERRLYVKEISKAEKSKHDCFVNQYAVNPDQSSVPMGLLDQLTPDDTRHLIVSEDELATSRRFTRIFPTNQTHKYLRFMDKPKYYNLLLSAWEQRYNGMNREAGRSILEKLCLSKHHLKVPANVYVKKTALGTQETIDISGLAAPVSENVSTQGSDKQTEDVVACQTDSGVSSHSDNSSISSQSDSGINSQSESAMSSQSDSGINSQSDAEMSCQTEKILSSLSGSSEVSQEGNIDIISSAEMKQHENHLTTKSLKKMISPSKTVKSSQIKVLAKPHNVRTVAPCANRGSKGGSLSSDGDSSSIMDWGSVTPSPKGTPEHPGSVETNFENLNTLESNITDNIIDNRQQLSGTRVDNKKLTEDEVVDNRPLV